MLHIHAPDSDLQGSQLTMIALTMLHIHVLIVIYVQGRN